MHIDDTVGVSLIAVIGTVTSGALSYRAAAQGADAQLLGVKTDIRKLQVSRADEARKERAAIYSGFLSAVLDMEWMARGLKDDLGDSAYKKVAVTVMETFNDMTLYGSEEVRDASEDLMEAIGKYQKAAVEIKAEKPDVESPELYSEALDRTWGDWQAARDKLRRAARADIGYPASVVNTDQE